MSKIAETLQKLIEENSESLQNFEEWISSQPHIPKNIPRAVLIRFLKVCKFDLEKAKDLLDKNVKFKIKHPYLFTDRNVDSEEFQRAIKTVQFTAFPKLSKEGYLIESYRAVSFNPDDFILKDMIRVQYMIHDMNNVIKPDINGIISIYDTNGFTFSYFTKILSQLPTMIHFMQFGQDSTCVDVKQLHVVNCSQIVSKFVSIIKPFLSKEFRDNMHFHPNGFESLHKFIDKEYLPVEFDGCNGSLNDYFEETLRNLHEHIEYVANDDNFFLIHEEN
ncbi:alpha-tocopherol transfer protein-like [Chironomus tepperi]|uniref:alpha-tocopherol transfer protein-like n=1 Tax=Chironomus tepperi TaxID=113505 RepID=UPI00391F4252